MHESAKVARLERAKPRAVCVGDFGVLAQVLQVHHLFVEKESWQKKGREDKSRCKNMQINEQG